MDHVRTTNVAQGDRSQLIPIQLATNRIPSPSEMTSESNTSKMSTFTKLPICNSNRGLKF